MKELQTKILAVMADVSYIKKDGQNQQQGYKFASAESIIGEVRAAAVKHGLLIAVRYTEANDLESGATKAGSVIYRVRVKAEIALSVGTEREIYTFYGEGADSGDKALPKAKTMCLKQALRQIFLIETGDHDADRETPPDSVMTDEQKLARLPVDVKKSLATLKQSEAFKGVDSATFREGIVQVLEANHGDVEALRGWIRDKGGAA